MSLKRNATRWTAQFLPRDAMRKRGSRRASVCPSVRPSVTVMHYTKRLNLRLFLSQLVPSF